MRILIFRRNIVACCLSMGLATYAGTGLADTTGGAAKLGDPAMKVLAGKVIEPSEIRHYFTTDRSAYPLLGQTDTDSDSDGTHIIDANVDSTFSSIANSAKSLVSGSGDFYSSASYNGDPYLDPHIGMLSDTVWAQKFRKDSADAQIKFTVTAANLSVMAKYRGAEALADFTADIKAYINTPDIPYWTFHQHAGLHAIDSGISDVGNHTVKEFTEDGPMGYLLTDPDDWSRDVSFGSYTGFVDLSPIPLGGDVVVEMKSMSLAMGDKLDSIMFASAFYSDPLSTSGPFKIEVTGLTPLNNPYAAAVPIPASFWLFGTVLFALCGKLGRYPVRYG